jgi:peptide/nickel transport system substrate-binding protein
MIAATGMPRATRRASTLAGWGWLAAVLLVLAACAPPTPEAPPGGRDTSRAEPSRAKTLTIAVEGEPEALVMSIGGGTKSISDHFRMAVHQHLVTFDARGDLHPMLAVEVPSQERGSWVVRGDGTMHTTYRLHSGVTWHDGVPLTARDFVFGWTVNRDPEIPMADRVVAQQIGRIDTPDDFTLVIEWPRLSPLGNAIVSDNVGPLPVHLLESIFLTDKERFQQLPWWTREFVGVGPYRLAEWEPGSHLTLKAYDPFYAGRPKIETILVRFFGSEQAIVAALLAGSVDGTVPGVVDFGQTLLVKREWERAGRQPLTLAQPSHWRVVNVQFRVPQWPDITDVHVRRGLLNAIDRNAMVDALFEGQSPVSDTFIPPGDAKWPWVQDVAVRYDFDLRRAEQELAQGGWRRGADGLLVRPNGEKVALPLWTTGGGQSEQELAMVGDYWKATGMTVDQVVLPNAQARDQALRASFPAFEITQQGLSFENQTRRFESASCPTERGRWTGSNRGCYTTPEVDRIIAALQTAIDPAEQRRYYRDYVKILTEELPVLPLWFQVRGTIFREGVSGVQGDTNPAGSITFNVIEWDIR